MKCLVCHTETGSSETFFCKQECEDALVKAGGPNTAQLRDAKGLLREKATHRKGCAKRTVGPSAACTCRLRLALGGL